MRSAHYCIQSNESYINDQHVLTIVSPYTVVIDHGVGTKGAGIPLPNFTESPHPSSEQLPMPLTAIVTTNL